MAIGDIVIQTKLQTPQIKGKIVRRDRLLNLLKENLDKKLILICADAGYGKTTLLAQFCAELKCPFIFYNLDVADNNLMTFFNYIVSGIQQLYPDFGLRTKGIISQTRNIEIIVGTFINEFVETIKDEFYIILDDYHHSQSSKEIANALDYFLRHLPMNLHFIISTRSTPSLNLAYYLAKQELVAIEKVHLQFNLKEIQLLLKEVYGLKISDVEAQRIEKHSEGWITAIQLILQKIYLIGEEKAKETLNGYVASGEEVFNYFAREVFESQPQEIQDFLMKTSILEYLNSAICNQLLNIKKSSRTLSHLDTEHIFITRIKDNYKYHPLFREFLFKRLTNSCVKIQIKLLYRRLARYFAQIGNYFNTAHYFLLSEDYVNAAKALERSFCILMVPGNLYPFLTLINCMPASIFEKHPYLLLEKGKIMSFLGRWEEALKILFTVKKNFERQKDSKGIIETLAQIGFVYLVLMQLNKALLYEKKAYKLINKRNQILKAKILTTLGNIYRVLGRYNKAENLLKEVLMISHKTGDDEIEEQALGGLARVYTEKDEFYEATEIYSTLLKKYELKSPQLRFTNLCTNAAALYIELNRFEKAEELLYSAEKFAKAYNDQRAIIYTLGIQGKLYLYQNDYQKALHCYEKVIELNRELKEKLVDLYARIDITGTYLAMNQVEKARLELKRIESLIQPQVPPSIFIDYLVIKTKTAVKDLHTAEKNLNHALKIAEKFKLLYRKMEILHHLSELYLQNGNDGLAINYLKKSIAIAKEKDYNFFFIRMAKSNLKIFEYVLNKGIEVDYFLSILKAVNTEEVKNLLNRTSRVTLYDLEIQLFDRMEIKDERGTTIEVNWRTKKMRSLLAFLLINKYMKSSRDELIEKLWPDKGRIEGTHNLHEHISYLRKTLSSIMGNKLKAKDIILYKNQFYFLNPKLIFKIDVSEFESLVKEAKKFELIDKMRTIQLYQNALDLYKDDFCKELYDDWCEEKRLYYRSIVQGINKEVGKYYYEHKDYQNCLKFYKRALEFEHCDEDVHLGIMRALSAMGDRLGMHNQYKILKRILSQELQVKPTKETERIYKELVGLFEE